jgi:hypothetical protein
MRKCDEERLEDSTWNRTHPDEPVFILCGRDMFAWEAVMAWIVAARRAGVNPAKIDEAQGLLKLMEEWPMKKRPD